MGNSRWWYYPQSEAHPLKGKKFKHYRRNRITKEERKWLKKYRIFIIDQGLIGFSDQEYGKPLNGSAKTLLRAYTRDLKFPRPRSFSVDRWMENGIFVTKDKGWDTWRKIRIMSVLRKRAVFVLWGTDSIRKWEKVIEPNMGHLIVKFYYPFHNKYHKKWENYKPFSMIADWLGVSREIWRL